MAKVVPATGCVHYWIFAPPNGHTSIGTCKYCGNKTEDVNYFDLPALALWKSDHQKVPRSARREKP
jgi:hypothetical protein